MKKAMMLCVLTLFILTSCATNQTAQSMPEKQQEAKSAHCFDNGKKDDYVTSMYYTELPLKDMNDLADVDIAKKLFSLYLDGDKAPSRPLSKRLAEYKIEDVTQVKDAYGEIFFYIGFSLRPCQKVFYEKSGMPNSPYWVEGGGQIRNDGWIRKMMYVRLAKREDQVRMILVGTGI